MANGFYGKGKKKILDGGINLLSDSIKAYLVKAAYVPSINSHEFLSDLGANILNVGVALSGRSTTLGVFDASPVTFSAVTAGDSAAYVVLAKDTGTLSTSPLIAIYDTITGFPALTNGGDIQVSDTGGASQWFSI